MTPRRQQTSLPGYQPVRAYKVIAITFLLLTFGLFGGIVLFSSKRAVITIETKPELVEVTGAVAVGPTAKAGALVGVVTSTEVTLTQTFIPTGTSEEPGVATGIITLHNTTPAAQTLVATTRLLSDGGVLFRMKDRVTIPANNTVDVAVYADKVGKESNVGPEHFILPGLTESKQAVIYGTSSSTMTGGVRIIGILNEADKKKAEKELLARVLVTGEKTLEQATGQAHGTFSLIDQTVTSDIPTGTTTAEFTLTAKGKVLGILYEKDDVMQWAKTLLMKRQVDDGEIIIPSQEAPTVTLDTFDLNTGSATVTVFYGGTATLNPESKLLDKFIFFGKTKDEVRRYVLHLDRVHGVDVSFTPSWMQTVPHIAEHVKVIVKQVE